MFTNFYKILESFNESERRLFWIAIGVLAISSVLWLDNQWRSATVAVPIESNLYREGVIGQPITINPVLAAANEVDRDLTTLLFTDLLTLAAEYQLGTDGLTWNINLKPNLRWSDGKPLTSDDVVFTLDTIQNSETQSPLSRTWQGVITNRISEREVEFTLRTPYAFFLDNLRDLRIIPKHIFSVIPSANLRFSNFNLEPVGSGPMIFRSLDRREDGFVTRYRLTTNPNFPGPKPFIKNFDVIFYPDSDALLEAFNQKKVDGFGGLDPKHLKDLRLSHVVLEKTMPYYYAIFLNKNSKASLKETVVIKAMQLAIDKSEIIQKVFSEKAFSINGPVLSFLETAPLPPTEAASSSPEEANKILDKNGWKMDNQRGVRAKKIGKKEETLEFTLVVPQLPFLVETANFIQGYWQNIGIQVELAILDPADISREIIRGRNYQMLIFGNAPKPNGDLFSFWHSSERFYPGLNLAIYENKKVDTLMETIRKTADAEVRKKDLAALDKIIQDDLPAIFLYSPSYLYVGPKDFGGLDEPVIASPTDRFRNVHQWYTETKRALK